MYFIQGTREKPRRVARWLDGFLGDPGKWRTLLWFIKKGKVPEEAGLFLLLFAIYAYSQSYSSESVQISNAAYFKSLDPPTPIKKISDLDP